MIGNFTKALATHTVKAGIYIQYSLKDQTSFTNHNGEINFADNTGNPFDTGYAYANAALGVFNTYKQANAVLDGKIPLLERRVVRPGQLEGQRRLTLDYGLRFYWVQPQYDAAGRPRTSSRLFGRGQGAAPVSAGDVNGARSGSDPVTGQRRARCSSAASSRTRGISLNGIGQAGAGRNDVPDGRSRACSTRRASASPTTSPASQSIILRGGGGVFYDRFQGNESFDLITNPPTTFTPAIAFGRLQELGDASTRCCRRSG